MEQEVTTEKPIADRTQLAQERLEENFPALLGDFFEAIKEGLKRREKVALDIFAQMAGYTKGKGVQVNTFVNAAPAQPGGRPSSFEDVVMRIQGGQQQAQLAAAEEAVVNAEFEDVIDSEKKLFPWEP